MKLSFNNRLQEICNEKNNRLCIGLDIDSDKLPKHMDRSLLRIHEFLKDVIDSTSELCVAYKLNMAFYEQFGYKGYKLMEDIVAYIDNRNITIADGKRGDIGNTSKKYAISIFDTIGFDSITISPYMGSDSIVPFTKKTDKGVFVLCITSNNSAHEIQFIKNNNITVFENVSKMAFKLNINDNIGLVIGATKPEFMDKIRKLNNLPWLIPGIGAQGGDLEKSVTISNKNSVGIINVSRSILYAGNCEIDNIYKAAKNYNNVINRIQYNG